MKVSDCIQVFSFSIDKFLKSMENVFSPCVGTLYVK